MNNDIPLNWNTPHRLDDRTQSGFGPRAGTTLLCQNAAAEKRRRSKVAPLQLLDIGNPVPGTRQPIISHQHCPATVLHRSPNDSSSASGSHHRDVALAMNVQRYGDATWFNAAVDRPIVAVRSPQGRSSRG